MWPCPSAAARLTTHLDLSSREDLALHVHTSATAMFKTAVLLCLLACSSYTLAFRVGPARPGFSTLRRMAEEQTEQAPTPTSTPTPASSSFDLVPLDKENIENAASVTTGVFGLLIGGPIGALLFAALGKYLSKKENEGGEAIRGVGKAVVEAYNFVTKLNSKYKLSDKAIESVSKAASSADAPEPLSKVTKTTNEVVDKLKQFNSEYDLVNKSKQALGVAATLSDSALEKLEELNTKVSLHSFPEFVYHY